MPGVNSGAPSQIGYSRIVPTIEGARLKITAYGDTDAIYYDQHTLINLIAELTKGLAELSAGEQRQLAVLDKFYGEVRAAMVN